MREPEIRCPHCRWRPQAEDRWHCVPSCGTVWHTFWTGGVCPGCGWRWEKTQCLACQKVSPHKAWYHFPTDEPSADRVERTRDEPVTAR
jgi:C4-type Zn-finger protein